MFERFTERARHVVVLGQDEARSMRHQHLGTEHLLLGLLREKEGMAARVLGAMGVTIDSVRGHVVRIVGLGTEPAITGQIPFTPRAKKLLEIALREALSLGHNYIGTEHILLGMARENEGVAARILLDFDADAEKIRNEIIRQLSPRPRPRMSQVARTYKLNLPVVLDDGSEVMALMPVEYIAEAGPETDPFVMSAATFNNLGGPKRIVVTVSRAEP